VWPVKVCEVSAQSADHLQVARFLHQFAILKGELQAVHKYTRVYRLAFVGAIPALSGCLSGKFTLAPAVEDFLLKLHNAVAQHAQGIVEPVAVG
jgi:hypothetical protein